MKLGSLFDRIFGFLGQLIALNLLWIVCSLPIITAGASTTALFYCTLKIRKGSKMSNGLLAMYIFLAVFATGLVIYSKMSDRKRQEK